MDMASVNISLFAFLLYWSYCVYDFVCSCMFVFTPSLYNVPEQGLSYSLLHSHFTYTSASCIHPFTRHPTLAVYVIFLTLHPFHIHISLTYAPLHFTPYIGRVCHIPYIASFLHTRQPPAHPARSVISVLSSMSQHLSSF